MNIKDLFFKPLDRSINGVVKADQSDDVTVFQELDEYVVTNELEKHFRDFFQSYTTDLTDASISNKVGVWISGFFGSGKSHFLKTLSYILANQSVTNSVGEKFQAVDFFDESKIRDAFIRADIDRAVSQQADVILFNIDSKASANDDGDPILNVFLRVFNEHQGFSGDHPHIAHMERHLVKKSVYQDFKTAFEEISGLSWIAERDGYQFYQDDIEQALSRALDLSADAARKWFDDSETTFSVSVESFCHWVKEYLDNKNAQSASYNHRLLFLVDEVGQFIGNDTKRMLKLQTITENLGTICQGRGWIVVTSQADIDAIIGELSSTKANDFSKIAGRFKTRLSLSSSNTDEVIQKRLLRKTPEANQQLQSVFEKKGDILKNQITFDRSGPTLNNYDGPESFANNYPFAPYHFQLVQKVFEQIRKVGATGAHLAYGERSMLDAFQMAANGIAQQPVGTLVPMYRFYAAVEGFLDTAVKRTIDQAAANKALTETDGHVLKTLFMIRYVDLIKGTLDNLVTLSIEQIDVDKLALRRQIETSLQRLEKESLITRNGDEFLFLTNEERDITQKIKMVDISSSEENKFLSETIYKDILKDTNKYRYKPNKTDYSIGRYVDSHTLDGRHEPDLKIEVITPLDLDYGLFNDGRCIGRSNEANGQILLKLDDDKQLFSELRTWLKTNKYIRLNGDTTQPEIRRILDDRSRENLERKKRLSSRVEELLVDAEIYVLGQKLQLKSASISTRCDEAYGYLLENTYTKLDYIQTYQSDALRELSAILLMDDVAQAALDLNGQDGNPRALKEVDEFIRLRCMDTERLYITEILNKYSARPYGWPENETLILISRLVVAGKISFQKSSATLAARDAFDVLKNTRQRTDVSILKLRQTDEGVLKLARNLTRDLFAEMGPASEKELYEFYQVKFNDWYSNLTVFSNKTEIGQFPGKTEIEKGRAQLDQLLNQANSFDFFHSISDKKEDLLDLEEDYNDLEHFFNHQLTIWQQLQQALQKFKANRQSLEADPQAKQALAELIKIQDHNAPYDLLNKVSGLIDIVDGVLIELLADKRRTAQQSIEQKLEQLTAEIDSSGLKANGTADNEISQLLCPLVQLGEQLHTETSVADIYMLESQLLPQSFDRALEQFEQLLHKVNTSQSEQPVSSSPPVGDDGLETPAVISPSVSTTAVDTQATTQANRTKIKSISEINVASVLSKSNQGVYLESEASVNRFIEELKLELTNAINNNQRVRLR